VSVNTALESGIPPARVPDGVEALGALTLDDGVERLDTALAGVTRTEANLSLLFRGLKHLAEGAVAARDANAELIHELDGLRSHLARSHDEDQATRFRSNQLEQLLDIVRDESARERAFLIEQQDLFLIEIINDHERQVAELQRMIRDITTRKADFAQLSELTLQRDLAREYATRCERERDLAWQELAALGSGPGLASAPAPTLRRPGPLGIAAEAPGALGTIGSRGASAIGAIHLRSVQVPAPSLSEHGQPVGGFRPPPADRDADE
jgi:hypothetical protein